MRFIDIALIACVIAVAAPAHGPKTKTFFNANKANAAVRGGSGAGAVQLYMMQPARQVTGAHEAVGFEATLRDEDPLTAEFFDMSFVRYDPSGTAPDESAAGVIVRRNLPAFGFQPPFGVKTFLFNYTIGRGVRLPDTFGIGVTLPANASWPQSDGLSIVAQLNLPNDPNRPRVPAAHANAVWAFERLPGSTAATPLGGRTLDALAITGAFSGSVLQGFVQSYAYGGASERLYGPESMFPQASRGDALGVFVHAGFQGFPVALLYLSPRMRPSPWCCVGPPVDRWYLELAAPFPLLLQPLVLDVNGQATFGPIPAAAFPVVARDFWLQAALLSQSWQIQLTDAVGFAGM